jgi:molybdate transport system substrate-binding protein
MKMPTSLFRFSVAAALVFLLLPANAAQTSPKQFNFTVAPFDAIDDLHGSPLSADLVIFAAGNQFMVMPALLKVFQASHPTIHRVFYETLPPGIEAKQIAAGSVEIGNLLTDVKPDVMLTGLRAMKQAKTQGLVSHYVTYASNQLAIEVAAGNPKGVHGLTDPGRDDVRVSMPNPRWEGVAAQIEAAYRKAGGEALSQKIMQTKLDAGTTLLTRIHHRETSLNIIAGKADAGPVWISEALYARRIGSPIDFVEIPPGQNVTGNYVAAALVRAPHVTAAREFVDFMAGPVAAAIYRSYGFDPPQNKSG